ncbi:MAG: transcriptional regulator [Nitrososphaeraceae archaeon]
MTQLLCVSVKAVQSYEQGWRNIPSYIERQLLLLISLKKTPNRKIKPCWDLKDCAPEWRVKCIVWYCQGKIQKNWNDKIKLCRECVIYKDMLADI